MPKPNVLKSSDKDTVSLRALLTREHGSVSMKICVKKNDRWLRIYSMDKNIRSTTYSKAKLRPLLESAFPNADGVNSLLSVRPFEDCDFSFTIAVVHDMKSAGVVLKGAGSLGLVRFEQATFAPRLTWLTGLMRPKGSRSFASVSSNCGFHLAVCRFDA